MTPTGSVFVDGTLTRPQLDHPECVAIARDGAIWCGGEHGQIYRVEPDGSSFTQIATTDGFILGIAFTPNDDLLVCDLRHHCVFRLPAGSHKIEPFSPPIETPNFPCVAPDGSIWVTDSGSAETATGTIHRYDTTGKGGVWADGPFHFANGLALSPDGRSLHVVETFSSRISSIAIESDGSAGRRSVLVELPNGVLPDGVAYGPDGALYVGCYEPSRILRTDTNTGETTTYFEDKTAHLLCHPTNIAWRGDQLFTANLGRWHLTVIE